MLSLGIVGHRDELSSDWYRVWLDLMVVNLSYCDTVIAKLFWESVDVRFAQA